MLYGKCLACKGIIPVLFCFFECSHFHSSCFLQSGLCSKAKPSWRCHSSNSWNPLRSLKRSFLVLSCGTTMSCGGVSKSKIVERLLGFAQSYIQRMTPNGVERHQSLRTPLRTETLSRIFWASSGEQSNTDVAFKERPCGKLVWALWVINQTPQSPLENSAQDGWSRLRLYQITGQVPSVNKPFRSHSASSSSPLFCLLFCISRSFIWMPTVSLCQEQK